MRFAQAWPQNRKHVKRSIVEDARENAHQPYQPYPTPPHPTPSHRLRTGTDSTDCNGPRRVVKTGGAPSVERADRRSRRRSQALIDDVQVAVDDGALVYTSQVAHDGAGMTRASTNAELPAGQTRTLPDGTVLTDYTVGTPVVVVDPPSPPPPPPNPPPPPPPPPPPVYDFCECDCTLAVRQAEDDWSDVAVIAQSVPDHNTRLYRAHAELERGGSRSLGARIYVSGVEDSVQRYVSSPALDLPIAHATSAWKLSTPAVSLTLARIDAPPTAYGHACPLKEEWAVQIDEPDGGACAEPAFNAHCLVDPHPQCVTTTECIPFFCPSFNGTAGCESSQENVCRMCLACFEHGAPYADGWKRLPDASSDADYWLRRCASECAQRTPRYLLHLVQFDLANGECQCHTSATPEPPDNAAVMAYLTAHGTRDTSGTVNVYTVGPPSYTGAFDAGLGGTLYYARAYEPGFKLSVGLDDVGTTWAHPEGCALACARKLGKANVAGFLHDAGTHECQCTARAPLSIVNRAVIMQSVGADFVMHSAFWCEGAAPSGSDSDFVYSATAGAQQWCPGIVPEHLGEALIDGTLLAGPGRADLASACVDSCGTGCNRVSISVTSWQDVVGRVVASPSPPPSPPTPPPPPLPSRPPLPPLGPLAGAGERFRTWTPDGYEFATKDADGLFSITCRAEACDTSIGLPIFRGEYLETHQLATELYNTRKFVSSLCPVRISRLEPRSRCTCADPTARRSVAPAVGMLSDGRQPRAVQQRSRVLPLGRGRCWPPLSRRGSGNGSEVHHLDVPLSRHLAFRGGGCGRGGDSGRVPATHLRPKQRRIRVSDPRHARRVAIHARGRQRASRGRVLHLPCGARPTAVPALGQLVEVRKGAGRSPSPPTSRGVGVARARRFDGLRRGLARVLHVGRVRRGQLQLPPRARPAQRADSGQAHAKRAGPAGLLPSANPAPAAPAGPALPASASTHALHGLRNPGQGRRQVLAMATRHGDGARPLAAHRGASQHPRRRRGVPWRVDAHGATTVLPHVRSGLRAAFQRRAPGAERRGLPRLRQGRREPVLHCLSSSAAQRSHRSHDHVWMQRALPRGAEVRVGAVLPSGLPRVPGRRERTGKLGRERALCGRALHLRLALLRRGARPKSAASSPLGRRRGPPRLWTGRWGDWRVVSTLAAAPATESATNPTSAFCPTATASAAIPSPRPTTPCVSTCKSKPPVSAVARPSHLVVATAARVAPRSRVEARVAAGRGAVGRPPHERASERVAHLSQQSLRLQAEVDVRLAR